MYFALRDCEVNIINPQLVLTVFMAYFYSPYAYNSINTVVHECTSVPLIVDLVVSVVVLFTCEETSQ